LVILTITLPFFYSNKTTQVKTLAVKNVLHVQTAYYLTLQYLATRQVIVKPVLNTAC